MEAGVEEDDRVLIRLEGLLGEVVNLCLSKAVSLIFLILLASFLILCSKKGIKTLLQYCSLFA